MAWCLATFCDGSFPGPLHNSSLPDSGATCEHDKVLLDDAEALELFVHAANLLASAQIPTNIAAALAVSSVQSASLCRVLGCVGGRFARVAAAPSRGCRALTRKAPTARYDH